MHTSNNSHKFHLVPSKNGIFTYWEKESIHIWTKQDHTHTHTHQGTGKQQKECILGLSIPIPIHAGEHVWGIEYY